MSSKATTFITLSSLILIVSASPFTTPNSNLNLFDRATNPCQPGGTPILYKDYYNAPAGLCGPPATSLGLDDSNNIVCPGNYADHCYTYCEIYQYFQYDVEQPVIANPACHGPLTCTVTDSMAFTYTYSGSLNVGLGSNLAKVFAAGVTDGFSYASAKTQLVAKSVNLKKGQCGYMTFLPQLHYSWYESTLVSLATSATLVFPMKTPSLTKYATNHSGTTSEGIWGNKKCNEYTTTSNVCSAQASRSADGSQAIGTTVFVWIDCGTNERLPMSQQDPAYQQPGVALPQSTYVSTFQTCSCGEDGCTSDSPSCCGDNSCPAGSNVVGGGAKRL